MRLSRLVVLLAAAACACSAPPPTSSERFVDPETWGHADPGGAPSWVGLEGRNPEPAWSAERDLALFPHATWFRLGWGPPAHIDDLATEVEGSSLKLSVRNHRPRELVLEVELHAGPRGLQAGVWPFLFAFEADGVPVVLDARGALVDGDGAPVVRPLAPGESRRWTLEVVSPSVDRIAPRPLPERLSVVAAFCEVEHGTWFVTARRAPPPRALDLEPPVLLRTERVDLVRGPDGWEPE